VQAEEEADRTHHLLVHQAQQHEAFFALQLQEQQTLQQQTLSKALAQLRRELESEMAKREAELRREKQLEVQQHLKVQQEAHTHELTEALNRKAAEIWEIRFAGRSVRAGRPRVTQADGPAAGWPGGAVAAFTAR
jgi:hypothetical protein